MARFLCMIGVQIMVMFCLSSECKPGPQLDQDETVARVKRLDVSKLDPSLPREEFATWFGGIVRPGSDISWEMNDCGEQAGGQQDVDRDIPTCVEAEATVAGNWNVIVMIQIGTVRKGPLATPVVKDAFIQQGDQTYTAHSLGELVRLLKKRTGN